jgi:hypothetical protein
MQIQRIKMIACAVWVLAAIAIATIVGASGVGLAAAAAFAFLPPLALLFLWNEPKQTMSESISRARR